MAVKAYRELKGIEKPFRKRRRAESTDKPADDQGAKPAPPAGST